jgi:hypothetical protein
LDASRSSDGELALLQQRSCLDEEDSPNTCQLNVASRAMKQHHPELVLEQLNLLAERRLRHF